MRLWRVLPWDSGAADDAPGGALWFPRPFQGGGRHDEPSRYGCLYLAELPVAAVAELLAPFRGRRLTPAVLHRAGPPVALAELRLRDDARLLDLDDPLTLVAEALRPSRVATTHRAVTQAWAQALFDAHADVAGLRWWSVLEASWINVTLFEHGADALSVEAVVPLALDDEVVLAAVEALGLAP